MGMEEENISCSKLCEDCGVKRYLPLGDSSV